MVPDRANLAGMKRLLILAVLASGFAIGTAHASCANVDYISEGRAVTKTPGLSVTITQVQTFTICDAGDPTLNAETGFLRVFEDDELVCERDDVNVSVDPFGFGAGLDMDVADEGRCAIGVSMSSLDQPTLPFAEESSADPSGATVATSKSVIAQGLIGEEQIHGLRLDGDLHEIADGAALFVRKAVATPAA